MLEAIRQLIILQERDIRLARLIREIDSIPAEEKRIVDQLAQQSQKQLELKTAAAKLETDRKELDAQATAKRTQIGKYRAQQLETRKNEEFQALTQEIARAEQEISKIEDQELEIMEKLEGAMKAVSSEALHVKEHAAAAEAQRATLRAKQNTLASRRGELEAEIKQIEATVEPSALEKYRRLLSSKHDAVVVPLVHETTCSGCHMKITHQNAIAVKAGTAVIHCEQCGRILYLPEM